MQSGLEVTLKKLAETDNEAAVELLVSSLWARQFSVREGAMQALLARKGTSGKAEIIRLWTDLEARWKELVAEKQGRMSVSLREAMGGEDEVLFQNACDAAVFLRDYDVFPVLITTAEAKRNPFSKPAEETIVRLAEQLYLELAAPRKYGGGRRDPQISRRNSLSHLEDSLNRFSTHRCSGLLEAFLMLVSRENATLKIVLQSPKSQTFKTASEVLRTSEQPGVRRLLTSFMDDPQSIKNAVQLVGLRHDQTFLNQLLEKIGFHPEDVVLGNLQKIDAIPWISKNPELLDPLTDAHQQAAIQFSRHSSMPRRELYRVIVYLLDHGKAGGKRAAATALAEFTDPEANGLAMDLLSHGSPEIQAVIIGQIRDRNVPGAMNRLIEFVDSDHPEIQAAAQTALDEFSFERYLTAFDMLDDDVRRTTGELVRKVDRNAKKLLISELQEESRSRCMRGLCMAAKMGLVDEVESEVLRHAANTDHFIRADAVRALGSGTTLAGFEMLQELVSDNSVSVREAATEALEKRRKTGQEPSTEPPNFEQVCGEEL